MPDATQQALTLISCGALILYAGVYTVRLGMHGDYLQRFQLWGGRRKYTRNPSPADRQLYTVAGWLAVAIGLAVVAAGMLMWVGR
jgi:hypothetical protein